MTKFSQEGKKGYGRLITKQLKIILFQQSSIFSDVLSHSFNFLCHLFTILNLCQSGNNAMLVHIEEELCIQVPCENLHVS